MAENDSGGSETVNKGRMTTTGKILLGVTGGVITGIFAVTLPFISPALRKMCLPYVPATSRQVDNVMILLKGKSGSVIDLGSGDGRIVHEAAKRGFRSSGVELNPWLIWFSKITAIRLGISKETSFYRKDIWKTDLSTYNNVIIFGVEQMMGQLEQKFEEELQRNSHVIACRFPLPTWTPVQTVESGIDTVWLYQKYRSQAK